MLSNPLESSPSALAPTICYLRARLTLLHFCFIHGHPPDRWQSRDELYGGVLPRRKMDLILPRERRRRVVVV